MTCRGEHAPGAACGACRADRLALAHYEAALTAADRERARQLAEADRLAARQAREDADRQSGDCGQCNAEGTAEVRDASGAPVLDDDGEPATVRCRHDGPAANRRAYEARLACRAAVPTTRATAAPRARTRALAAATTAQPQEA